MVSSEESGATLDGASGPRLRPRYGRIAALGASVLLTGTAVLGGLGVLPSGGSASYAAAGGSSATGAEVVSLTSADERARRGSSTSPSGQAVTEESAEETTEEPDPDDLLVPEDSGEGRRVVFDEGAQRVWLVGRDGSVERTYLVSGSIYDNLDPGTYQVYSRSEQAWGIDDSGTMRYMVRFTTGSQAPIGFHDIPVLDGERVQTRGELGTPLSHGCIRQARPDAKALWDFAQLGTTVVVVDTSAEEAPTSDEDQSAED